MDINCWAYKGNETLSSPKCWEDGIARAEKERSFGSRKCPEKKRKAYQALRVTQAKEELLQREEQRKEKELK